MYGAVLAGGDARRLGGRPKGLEQVGGTRILDRVTTTIEDAIGTRPLLIADPRSADTWGHDLDVVGDAIPGCGSLGGIYTALTATQGPTLIVAWDMPFVTTPLLRRLVDGIGVLDAFLPESNGPQGLEPLCAVYGPNCIRPIRDRLDAADFRATGFHDAVRVGVLSLADIRQHGDPELLFFNVNTESDLEQARAVTAAREG